MLAHLSYEQIMQSIGECIICSLLKMYSWKGERESSTPEGIFKTSANKIFKNRGADLLSHFASSAAYSPKQEVDYKLIQEGVRACRQTPMVQEQEQSLAQLLQRHAGIPATASCSILARALLTANTGWVWA